MIQIQSRLSLPEVVLICSGLLLATGCQSAGNQSSTSRLYANLASGSGTMVGVRADARSMIYGPVPASHAGLQDPESRGSAPKVTQADPAPAGESATDLAKKTQNPVADLISVPIQNNMNFGVGPNDHMQNVTNIQPVVPTKISDDWLLINRAIIPILYDPPPVTGAGGQFGLGNIQYQGFFSPITDSKYIWGAGPIVQTPSNTDSRLGPQSWSVGPAAVFVAMPDPWVLGAVANQLWSLNGDTDDRVNLTFVQLFANYNLEDGLYLSSAPVITANWEADKAGDIWTVPLGGGIGKLFKLGKQPINVQAQVFYTVVQPKFAPDWTLRLQMQFLF